MAVQHLLCGITSCFFIGNVHLLLVFLSLEAADGVHRDQLFLLHLLPLLHLER